MDGINRKPMKDVLVPQDDIIRRPSFVPELRPKAERTEEPSRIEKNPFFEKQRAKNGTQKSSSGSKGWLWLVAILAFLGAVFGVVSYFSSSTVDLVPVTQKVILNQDFTVPKETQDGGLTFQFMSLTEEKTKEVPATVEKEIQRKASGKVMVYNTYSSESQRLIKNTRLESSDHKIFRIDGSVVVPGAKMAGGKVLEPGSVEVAVYADAPGKEYNIGLADFSIPGFKGDPRYTKFVGHSSTSTPLAGGFSGTIKVPTDEVIAQAQKDIKDELKVVAVEKARAQIPEGVSFFPGSMVLKFEEVPQDLSADQSNMVTMRATVSVFFFDTTLLTQKLAEAAFPEHGNIPLVLSNMPTLSFNFLDPVDTVVLSDLDHIRFHLGGEAVFIGKVDKEKLIAALVGKNKKEFEDIIKAQGTIKKANMVVWPLWQNAFPSDSTKISVKILDN